MLTLISINILDTVLDLIDMDVSHPRIGASENVIILEVDMRSSTKIDNRKKDILTLGKDPTQGLNHTICRKNVFN